MQVALQQLQEYQMLTALTHAPTHVGTINGQSSGGSSGGSGSGSSSSVFQAQAVCDRCMQPIDEAMHAAGVQRLQVCPEAAAMKGVAPFDTRGARQWTKPYVLGFTACIFALLAVTSVHFPLLGNVSQRARFNIYIAILRPSS